MAPLPSGLRGESYGPSMSRVSRLCFGSMNSRQRVSGRVSGRVRKSRKTNVPASITQGGHIELADRAAMGTDRTTWQAVHPQWGTSFLERVEALIELRTERLPPQGTDAMLRECAILVNEL